MVDTMHEVDAHIALVTETWMKNTPAINRQLQDMQDALGYACIRKDRVSGNGGGVAILYKTGDLVLNQIKTGTNHEIVAAVGRRIGQRRKIVVVAAYVPPGLNAEASELVLQKIADLIGTFKRRYNSPYILLGGDFNKRQIEKELRIFNDISIVPTPPRRGDNVLDLVFTNFGQYIQRAGVTEPICNNIGTFTDHKTVYVNTKMPRVPEYEIQKYSYYQQTSSEHILGKTPSTKLQPRMRWSTSYTRCSMKGCRSAMSLNTQLKKVVNRRG